MNLAKQHNHLPINTHPHLEGNSLCFLQPYLFLGLLKEDPTVLNQLSAVCRKPTADQLLHPIIDAAEKGSHLAATVTYDSH